jgi:hypothetical protein
MRLILRDPNMRLILFALSLPVLLTGCALGPTAPSTSESALPITGNVHGGQQPVSGAHVYLFAANTTGYGSASVSLLTSVPNSTTSDSNGNYYVTTSANGGFAITGDYTCTLGQQVYLYAQGGDPGAGSNSSAGFLAVLGNCPGGSFATQTPFVTMNEITTIASAYALSGFATDPVHVADDESVGTNPNAALAKTGMANAFANASNLASVSSGVALSTTPAGNGIVPQATIDTLADILAACINSTGALTGPTSPTPCYALLNNALSGGTSGTIPADTAAAAINIAHNPSLNIPALYALSSGKPPFAPALATAPSDFTLALTFTGSRTGPASTNGYFSGGALAIDSFGNVFTNGGNPGTYSGSTAISKLSPLGADLSTPTTFLGASTDLPTSLALDSSNNIWVVNTLQGYVNLAKYSNDGQDLSGTGFTGGGFNAAYASGPSDLTFDPSGDPLVYFDNVLTLFTPSGGLYSPAPAYPSFSSNVAYNGLGDLWYASGENDLSELLPTGTASTGSPFTGGGLNYGSILAIGQANSIFVANDNNTLSIFDSTGVPITSSAIPEPVQNQAYTIALDGANTAFIASNIIDPSSIERIATSGSTVVSSTTYGQSILHYAFTNVAVDGSGNVWIGDLYEDNYPDIPPQRIVEFVGLATPVVTPLATAVATGTLATRP